MHSCPCCHCSMLAAQNFGRSLGRKKGSASLMYWSVAHLVSAEMYKEGLLFMHGAVHV